ncbi:MAG TPA: DUF1194 domain-containing protein [Xanthobacteraceae bacterium]|jgi:uncharacterized protein DUF1194|nr:DUF1194 domain-containing protein [Xanthobacteraceae bacterium]
MPARTLLISVAVAMAASGIAIAGWNAGGLSQTSSPRLADRRPSAIPVDTELVIAVDVSNSMDPEEQELQREGYIAALTSQEFLSALRGGATGKVAVTYFEWAGLYDQKIILPWRLIDGLESAKAVANDIARAPYRRAPRTSIYGALQFAKPLFDASGYGGVRRVIDVSGDGVNNMGPPVTLMRDDVLNAGITINGLPIMLDRGNSFGMFGMQFEHLDIYYEDCVIGGPGSFVVGIKERAQFKDATRTKLVLEIAGHTPEPKAKPAQARVPRVYCS